VRYLNIMGRHSFAVEGTKKMTIRLQYRLDALEGHRANHSRGESCLRQALVLDDFWGWPKGYAEV
jgi:hypothetical protein